MSPAGSIIGIGEALLAEDVDRRLTAGLAADVARAARRFGRSGIPISRLGQDPPAELILNELRQADIDVSHLQSDPDLPTARRRVRRIAGQTIVVLDDPAAFDRLQWDFDLLDVAQQADVVFTGLMAMRSPQAATVIKRFLFECPQALRIADLRPPTEAKVERSAAKRLLELCQATVIDDAGLRLLRVNATDAARASDVLRQSHDLLFALDLTSNAKPSLVTTAEVMECNSTWDASACWTGIMAVTLGLLRGLSARETLHVASGIVDFIAQHPDDTLPDDLRDAVTGRDPASLRDQK